LHCHSVGSIKYKKEALSTRRLYARPLIAIINGIVSVDSYSLCVGKEGKSACGKKKRSRPWK